MPSNHRMNSISWITHKKFLNMWTLGETSSLFYLFQFAAAVSGRGILLLSLGFSMRFASQQFLFHKHLKHLEL